MNDFYTGRYKKMMAIPLFLFIPLILISLFFPGISQGTDLTGGTVIIVHSDKPLVEADIRSALAEFNLPELKVSTISSPTTHGAWISYSKNPAVEKAEGLMASAEATMDNNTATAASDSMALSNEAIVALGGTAQEFKNEKLALIGAQDALAAYKEKFEKKLQDVLVQKLGLGENAEFQKREVSPSLGSATMQSALFLIAVGFALIVIIIFISFRQFIPSAAIIQCMIFDVLGGLTGMALFNIPLSLTTIPALLMLIGYSVDTDIMLTSRMLKGKEGTPAERATASMKTGITMTGTTLAALIAMLAVSYLYQIDVIFQISAILFCGLLADVTSTWLLNAPILLWFVEKKNRVRRE